MTRTEKYVYERLIKEGYEVLHTGCPDFLCYKDGKISFIEVKSGGDITTEDQDRFLALLRSAGIQAEVEYVNLFPKPSEVKNDA